MQQAFTVRSLDELKTVVSVLRSWLSGRDILLLTGPMGVGKTELTRALLASYQGEEPTSPSFAIHNNYSAGDLSIDHLDLYRIEDEDDLESTGFWDLFDQKSGLIILEWADKLDQKMLPPQWKKITLELSFLNENERLIRINKI